MYNDKQSEGERFFEQNDGQTPVVLGTPYGYNCNMAQMSIYDASVRFTPGNIKISSNFPQYIQGSGSGLYNSTPKVQGSGNTSQYHPALPNFYQTSPSYNIAAINNASPFYKQKKDDDDEEEEENEDNDKNNN